MHGNKNPSFTIDSNSGETNPRTTRGGKDTSKCLIETTDKYRQFRPPAEAFYISPAG